MSHLPPTQSAWQRLRESIRLVGLAMRLVWRSSPRLALAILPLLFLEALLAPLQLATSRAVIDRAAFDLGVVVAVPALIQQVPLLGWIIAAAAVIAVGQLMEPFVATMQNLAGDRLTGYLTERLIQAANRWQGLERFEDPGFADDLHRAQRHTAIAGLRLMVDGAWLLVALITAAGLAVLLFSLHPLAPLLLVVATLPQMAREWEFQSRTGDHFYWQAPEARRLQYSREVLLTPEPAKDVRLYGLGAYFSRAYDAIFGRTAGMLNRLRRRLLPPVIAAHILAAAAAAAGGVFTYVAWQIARGHGTPGDLALYGGAAVLLQQRLLSFAMATSAWPLVLGFLPALARVLEAPPDLPLPVHPRHLGGPLQQGIVFEHVAFTYPGQSDPVLRDVSFQLGPAESVALVGYNGAGKTTLIKLLLRLYDPTAGRILVDGVDLREYDLDDLRQQLGVIFQDFVQYELTARENVGLGQVTELTDDARLRAAVAKAGADDLIQQVPNGLDTQLGRLFGGRELSGGEWQKLALARAFVRECSLLVLDEPTAALDVQTEYDVYTRFQELTRDRLTLLISHRFSTVRMADRILYLADGAIQESGSHRELMARNGENARLYGLQAAQFLGQDPREAVT